MEDLVTIRFALTLHYDGSDFHGWQVQPGLRTVQGELEAALSRLADRPRTVTGAGRTDAGVHATGQVAAVEMPERWTRDRLERALNAVLPDDVWVASVRRVPDRFHPRFDATARSYAYRVGTAAASASPFRRRRCWALGQSLDQGALDACAEAVVGRHSFDAFAKSGQPERGTACRVEHAEWRAWRHGVTLRITADRFLHHMVRYLVGTMVDEARGARARGDLRRLLEDPTSGETSPPAPPQGLTLVRVAYPASAHNPDRSPSPELRSPTPA